MKQQLGQITAAFERLSAREQGMVLFMVVAILVMIFGFGGYFVNKDLNGRRKRIVAKAEKLEEIGRLRTDYQRRLRDQQRIADEVRRNENMRLLSYLEDLSKQAQVELGNASERPGDPTGSDLVKEEGAEVLIKNVSLDRLNAFLEKIERGNRLVKVRRLKIKTRFDNKERLDASITVGTFKPTS
ncbi:MAG: hypothetical protein RIT81_10750 [Deltaproteobacteria bacterium]